MFYSRWETKDNIKNYLKKIEFKKNVIDFGLPLIYDDNSIYTTNSDNHSLIIGNTGSAKTQTIILPLLKLSLLAGESVVVNDPNGDIYKKTADEFRKRDYNVILLDYDNAVYGNYFNPLNLPYRLYNDNNIDKAINILENIGYYLFSDDNNNVDPFWTNSTIDYFTGLCLYLFNISEKEVNLNNVYALANKLNDEKECELFLREIDKNSTIYYNLSGTLTAPLETKGGIIATFNQKIKKFISKENLSNSMSKTDFDISSIVNKKTVIYMLSGYYDYSNNLISLFINQFFESVNIYGKHKKKINIILNEFDNLLPIKNFEEIINYSRNIKINFTCIIKSFVNLINTYGKDKIEIIKLCFTNIVYLYSNDLYTLEEISKLCGKESEKKLLISPEELKMLKKYEAVFLIPRIMPFKTKLTPDFEIDWAINFKEIDLELRK